MKNFSSHPLAGNHDIDSAFSKGWKFYKKWFLPLYGIGFIMALITAVLTKNVDISALQSTTDINEMKAIFMSMMGTYGVVSLISLLFTGLMQYYIIYRPLDDNFSIGEALLTVLRKYFLPLLAVYILLGLMSILPMILGILLLFIGLLFVLPYVLIFFAIAAPLIMIEGNRIDLAINRLFKLVHKKFWPNMGWMAVYIVLIVFISFIIGALVMIPFSGSIFKSFTDPDAALKMLEIAANPAYIILSSLATALTAPILPIFGLILYFNNSNSDSPTIDVDNTGSPENESDDQNEDDYRPSVEDLTP